jgi:outer membrane protein assembly factor BamA
VIAVGIGLLLLWGLAAAQVEEEPADSTAEASEESLTSRSVLPIAFYTPETKFGAGLAVGYFFKEAPEHRPNNISGIAIVTTESQASIGLTAETYSPDGSHHLKGDVGAQKFPYSFWGIGNSTPDSLEETYTPRAVEFGMLAERRILSNLTFGGRYRFWYEKVSETEAGGLLDSREIPGSRGGYSSGLGVMSTWDTRDNIYYTRRGFYAQIEATYFGPGLGSTYEYGIVDLDMRYFTPLLGTNSLGLRSVLRSTSGDTPFQDMPGIGGSFFLRGYPGRRYIDKAALTADVELRTAYFWRFSFVAFGSMGHVADRMSHLPDEQIRFTGGAGMRFRLNDEDFNLRVDLGFGEGVSGFYLIAGEAF